MKQHPRNLQPQLAPKTLQSFLVLLTYLPWCRNIRKTSTGTWNGVNAHQAIQTSPLVTTTQNYIRFRLVVLWLGWNCIPRLKGLYILDYIYAISTDSPDWAPCFGRFGLQHVKSTHHNGDQLGSRCMSSLHFRLACPKMPKTHI